MKASKTVDLLPELSPVTRRRLSTLRSVSPTGPLPESREDLKELHNRVYAAIAAGQSLDDLGEDENRRVGAEIDALFERFEEINRELARTLSVTTCLGFSGSTEKI